MRSKSRRQLFRKQHEQPPRRLHAPRDLFGILPETPINIAAHGAFDRPADVVAVARALGADALRVRTLDELRSGLAAFATCGGVRVLDIDIARSVLSEAYQRMHLPPPANQTGPTRGATR